MIDAQSIVVATASTGQVGQEGRILRFVSWHKRGPRRDHGDYRHAAGVQSSLDGPVGGALKLSAASGWRFAIGVRDSPIRDLGSGTGTGNWEGKPEQTS